MVIIRDLLSKGLGTSLAGSLVDFDAMKIPSLSGTSEQIREELRQLGIRYFEPPEVQYGMVTNYGGVRNWLLHSGATKAGVVRAFQSAAYNGRLLLLNKDVNGYHKMRILRALGLLK